MKMMKKKTKSGGKSCKRRKKDDIKNERKRNRWGETKQWKVEKDGRDGKDRKK